MKEKPPWPAAQVPLMITRDMEKRLKECGFSDSDIRKMKPEDAWKTLKLMGRL